MVPKLVLICVPPSENWNRMKTQMFLLKVPLLKAFKHLIRVFSHDRFGKCCYQLKIITLAVLTSLNLPLPRNAVSTLTSANYFDWEYFSSNWSREWNVFCSMTIRSYINYSFCTERNTSFTLHMNILICNVIEYT